jgi:chaperonin cofactor prefoldin
MTLESLNTELQECNEILSLHPDNQTVIEIRNRVQEQIRDLTEVMREVEQLDIENDDVN